MTKTEKLREAYGLISGELAYLPNKKWKTNSEYSVDFGYIKNKNLLKQISKYKMTLDYSFSLYELHKPLGPIQEIHFISLCQMVGSLCEAMLRDLLYFKIDSIENRDTAKIMLVKFSRPMLNELLEILKGNLTSGDKKYLGDIQKLRNAIHLSRDVDSIKYIEQTGHLIKEEITDEFLGGLFIRKEMNTRKLISDFELFTRGFARYYR